MYGKKSTHYWDCLNELRLSSSLCDVQLCVKENSHMTVSIAAHKIVLIASSAYFAGCQNEGDFLDVYNFDGVSAEPLQMVLDYMYRQIQWADLVKNPEAEVIAETLKVIKHDPFDCPSAGYVYKDDNGSNVVLIEKVSHSSGIRNVAGAGNPISRRRANRTAAKVFHRPEEVNKVLAEHNMKEVGANAPNSRDSSLSLLSEGDGMQIEPVEEDEAADVVKEVQVGLSDMPMNMVNQLPSEMVSEQSTEESISNPVENETALVPQTSIDLLASASEMVQRQQVLVKNDKRDVETEDVNSYMKKMDTEQRQVKIETKNKASESTPTMVIDPVTGDLVPVDDQHGDAPYLSNVQIKNDPGTPVEGRKSSRLAKKKDAIDSFMKQFKRNTKKPEHKANDKQDSEPEYVELQTPRRSTRKRKAEEDVTLTPSNTWRTARAAKINEADKEASPEMKKGGKIDKKVEATDKEENTKIVDSYSSEEVDENKAESNENVSCEHTVGSAEEVVYELTSRNDSGQEHGTVPIDNEESGDRGVKCQEEDLVKDEHIENDSTDDERGMEIPIDASNITQHESDEDDDTGRIENLVLEGTENYENMEISIEQQDGMLILSEDGQVLRFTSSSQETDDPENLNVVNVLNLDQHYEIMNNDTEGTPQPNKFSVTKQATASVVTMKTADMTPRVGSSETPTIPVSEENCLEHFCALCKKYFVNVTGYKNHMHFAHNGVKVHPEDGDMRTCDQCQAPFKTFAALATHMRIQHKMAEGYVCGECTHKDIRFKYHRHLKLHMVREHGLVLWFCDKCDQSFKSPEGYKIHMFKQHSGAKASHTCHQCMKSFVREQELRNHMRITHSEKRDHKCKVCESNNVDNSFKTSGALRRHIINVHSTIQEFSCDLCNSVFKTKNDMQRHREKHFRSDRPIPIGVDKSSNSQSEAEEGIFKCGDCGKEYKNANTLATHERIQHQQKNEAVSYMCTLCNKSFAVKQYLLMHLRNIHEPKRYQCVDCGLNFAQRYEVKRHAAKCRGYRIGDKPYCCVQCGKTFTLKGNLTKHLHHSCKGPRKEIGDVNYVLMVQKDGTSIEESSREPLETKTAVGSIDEESQEYIAGEVQDDVQYVVDAGTAAVTSGDIPDEILVQLESQGDTVQQMVTEQGQVLYQMVDADQQIIYTNQDGSQQVVQQVVQEADDIETLEHMDLSAVKIEGGQIVDVPGDVQVQIVSN